MFANSRPFFIFAQRRLIGLWRRLQNAEPYRLGAWLLGLSAAGMAAYHFAVLQPRLAQAQQSAHELEIRLSELQSRQEASAQSAPAASERHPTRAEVLAGVMGILRDSQLEAEDLVVSPASQEKNEEGVQQEDLRMELHGAYGVLVAALERMHSEQGARVVSLKLSRDAQQAGQVQADVVLRAKVSDQRGRDAKV